jgi:hypothetical protein
MLLIRTNSVLCCCLSGVSDKQAGMSRCLCHPETAAVWRAVVSARQAKPV